MPFSSVLSWGYERRAIRRSDHRRCCFGLHGYHHPDRRDVDRPYDAGHCRIAVDFEGLDDFVLQPTLYSERVKAQPLEIFLVILIAGSLAGVIGMLLAIPLYTVLRVFAKEFFSQISLVRKLTEKI